MRFVWTCASTFHTLQSKDRQSLAFDERDFPNSSRSTTHLAMFVDFKRKYASNEDSNRSSAQCLKETLIVHWLRLWIELDVVSDKYSELIHTSVEPSTRIHRSICHFYPIELPVAIQHIFSTHRQKKIDEHEPQSDFNFNFHFLFHNYSEISYCFGLQMAPSSRNSPAGTQNSSNSKKLSTEIVVGWPPHNNLQTQPKVSRQFSMFLISLRRFEYLISIITNMRVHKSNSSDWTGASMKKSECHLTWTIWPVFRREKCMWQKTKSAWIMTQ